MLDVSGQSNHATFSSRRGSKDGVIAEVVITQPVLEHVAEVIFERHAPKALSLIHISEPTRRH